MNNNSRGERFQPYISPRMNVRETGVVPIVMGALLGLVFGASSLYLVLKVGLTVSASIPVAVISITLFKLLAKCGVRPATILENNIVQTGGSAGESIAFGVGVTMPAIMLLGFELELGRIMIVATLGAVLGILMMIPLRKALIVDQHGTLKYPEGTACAEVLKAGDAGMTKQLAVQSDGDRVVAKSSGMSLSGKLIFAGFGIGLVYKAAMAAFHLWKEIPEKIFGGAYKGGSISAEISPELMGVGYIIGPRVASIMCAGGALSYLVLIPLIKFFGDAIPDPLLPATTLIKDMAPSQIRANYVMYIGAGAVATGGIINVCRSLPVIWNSIKEGLGLVGSAMGGNASKVRTEQDLSMKFVLIGIVVLVAAITIAPPLHMNLLGAVLLVVFGFLFSTVSSRVTGEIGSSSNPISGMTLATLIITCLIFLVLGWTSPSYYVTALCVGAVVAIAASNAGTTSQDLKTGFLVGATPKKQQIAIIIGALLSAVALGPILMSLNSAGTIYVPQYSYEKVSVETVATVDQNWQKVSDRYAPEGEFYIASKEALLANVKEEQELSNGDYLVTPDGKISYKVMSNFPATLAANPEEFTGVTTLTGIQKNDDDAQYHIWFNRNPEAGTIGKYLANEDGKIVYFVDPGVNGTYTTRPDGSPVTKFGAPQATLSATIIKGILGSELPWGLVITGVLIAVVLEMCKVPSLAFSVGLYLPISSSMPIFIGGLIRWTVDLYVRKKNKGRNLTEQQLTAETDKSPGVLLASGYIAGGAIAGIIIAFIAGLFPLTAADLYNWAAAHNPFFEGSWSNVLSLIPFILIGILLYLIGHEKLLKYLGKADRSDTYGETRFLPRNHYGRFGRNNRGNGRYNNGRSNFKSGSDNASNSSSGKSFDRRRNERRQEHSNGMFPAQTRKKKLVINAKDMPQDYFPGDSEGH